MNRTVSAFLTHARRPFGVASYLVAFVLAAWPAFAPETINSRLAAASNIAVIVAAVVGTMLVVSPGPRLAAPRIRRVWQTDKISSLLTTPSYDLPVDTLVTIYHVNGRVEMAVATGYIACRQADGHLQVEVAQRDIISPELFGELFDRKPKFRLFHVRTATPRQFVRAQQPAARVRNGVRVRRT